MSASEREATTSQGRLGPYLLLARVGKGGMGSVYKAEGSDGSIVAVKVLAAKLNDNPVQKSRFQQEARVTMALKHPNLVRAIDVGDDAGRYYLVMEYIGGGNMKDLSTRRGQLPAHEAVDLIIRVGAGVDAAHRAGVIHRDIKPENILLTDAGEPKLTDFGLVKALDDDLDLTKTGRGLGTINYMAPEQFRDAKNADARCDVYSLAATLYMLLAATPPYSGSNQLETLTRKLRSETTPIGKVRPDLPPSLVRAIERAMDPDPLKRPATVNDLIASLQAALRGAGAAATVDAGGIWYIVARDPETGETRKLKGSLAAIEQQARKGRLCGKDLASREKSGGFLPLESIPEFRGLFDSGSSQAVPPPAPSGQLARTALPTRLPPVWLMLAGAGLALILVGGGLWLTGVVGF